VQKVTDLWRIAKEVECDFCDENRDKFTKMLKDVNKLIRDIDEDTADAINEGVMLLSANDLNEDKIFQSTQFASAFGRGQQYVSLVKNYFV
jgi:uncharacterized membrane protein